MIDRQLESKTRQTDRVAGKKGKEKQDVCRQDLEGLVQDVVTRMPQQSNTSRSEEM